MRENTVVLYARWTGHAILALFDMALLIPLGVVLVVAILVRRGYYQKLAVNHILLELQELPRLTNKETKR